MYSNQQAVDRTIRGAICACSVYDDDRGKKVARALGQNNMYRYYSRRRRARSNVYDTPLTTRLPIIISLHIQLLPTAGGSSIRGIRADRAAAAAVRGFTFCVGSAARRITSPHDFGRVPRECRVPTRPTEPGCAQAYRSDATDDDDDDNSYVRFACTQKKKESLPPPPLPPPPLAATTTATTDIYIYIASCIDNTDNKMAALLAARGRSAYTNTAPLVRPAAPAAAAAATVSRVSAAAGHDEATRATISVDRVAG
ncbi:unnamed protein product [Trichogramma brassicae]|uniref:Uncharacterized protein n=1 Tax=Trichogramma brassicae TaxID=86971 RepID=A0A6H5HXH0_9HYME|nr:unnamed protein product [Trichogramma brassicae]